MITHREIKVTRELPGNASPGSYGFNPGYTETIIGVITLQDGQPVPIEGDGRVLVIGSGRDGTSKITLAQALKAIESA